MKITPWLRASVVFLLVGIAAAQKSNEAEVPVENEPHHHLVFENEYVRVFKVEVAPHEATLVHRHKRDYVVVTIGDAEVTNAVVGKEPKKWEFKDGDVTFLEATGEKSFAHKAVNDNDKPFVNLTIELKKPTGKKICGSKEDCRWSYAIFRCGPSDGPRMGFENLSLMDLSFCGDEPTKAEAPEMVLFISENLEHSLLPQRPRVTSIRHTGNFLWRDRGQEIRFGAKGSTVHAVAIWFGALFPVLVPN